MTTERTDRGTSQRRNALHSNGVALSSPTNFDRSMRDGAVRCIILQVKEGRVTQGSSSAIYNGRNVVRRARHMRVQPGVGRRITINHAYPFVDTREEPTDPTG